MAPLSKVVPGAAGDPGPIAPARVKWIPALRFASAGMTRYRLIRNDKGQE
jgi:hypothetical protein